MGASRGNPKELGSLGTTTALAAHLTRPGANWAQCPVLSPAHCMRPTWTGVDRATLEGPEAAVAYDRYKMTKGRSWRRSRS